jgi:hypothetical protein
MTNYNDELGEQNQGLVLRELPIRHFLGVYQGMLTLHSARNTEQKKRIREAMKSVNVVMLRMTWRELKYRLVISCAHVEHLLQKHASCACYMVFDWLLFAKLTLKL